MFDQEPPNIFHLIAAAAGAVAGLGLMPWEQMTWPRRFMTLFIAFASAFFVAPAIVNKLWGVNQADAQTVAMTIFLLGAGANAILPVIIKTITKTVGRVLGEKP